MLEPPTKTELEVAEMMKKVGANTDCPRCGNNVFRMLKGFLANDIQTSPRGISIGGPGIRTYAFVCSRCGFLAQHAADVLGIQPAEEIKH